MTSLLFFLSGAGLVLVVSYMLQRSASFRFQKAEHYANDRMQFDLRRHLNGPIECEGVIFGPLGRVTSRFVADFDVSWDGNVGLMKEHFLYDDGSEQLREWYLRIGNDGRILATAPDVIGDGEGVQCGAALQLKYRIKLPEDAGGHVLNTTDWMYLTPNGHIINRSQFRKFGIKVAELVATMRPREAA